MARLFFPTLVAGLAAAAVAAPAAAQPDPAACERAIARTEQRYPALPPGLLGAIARVESGRRMADGSVRPWPLAINLEGASHFFGTAAEALALVRPAVAGRRSIDIGCMQISLLHHPAAFRSHAEGLDPEVNVDYAARFLLQLRQKFGNWGTAVAHYHSGDPTRQTAYLGRVGQWWGQGARDVAARPPPRLVDALPSEAIIKVSGEVLAPPRWEAPRWDALLAEARGLYQRGDLAGADRLCATVPATAPQYREALFCRALTGEARGDAAGALRFYLAILVDHPADGGALTSIARLAANAPQGFGDWEKGLQWKRAEDAMPTLLTLARSPLREAPEYLARALKIAVDKRDIRAQLLIGMTYEGAGQPEQARRAYQDLLVQLGPQRGGLSESVRQRLEQLPPPPPAVESPRNGREAGDGRR